MHYFHRSMLVLALSSTITTFATAQLNQGTGPGLSRGLAPSAVFDITKAPFTCGLNIQQISTQHLTTDAPGVYTVGLSIEGLCAPYSSSAPYIGLLMAQYDLKLGGAPGSLVLNSQAAALNIPGHHQFNLQLEPGQGRWVVFDRFDSAYNYLGVYWSARTGAPAAFPAATMVTNIQGLSTGSGGYADPALGYVNGKLKLFYVGVVGNVRGIYMDDFLTTGPSVAGYPVLVKKSPRGGTNVPNSPTPITGPWGDVKGLWFADLATGTTDNDLYFSADLDPNSPSWMVVDNGSWKSNGAVCGGRLLFGDGGSNWKQIGEVQGAWLIGDERPIGGNLEVFGGSYAAPGNSVQTYVYLSTSIGAPYRFPGAYGELVLGISYLLQLGVLSHDASQIGSFSLPIPNDPSLKGLRLPIQGLSLETGRYTLTFTNNAWLKIAQ